MASITSGAPNDAWPARKAVLAGDHVLRVGEIELVRTAIAKCYRMRRSHATQRARLASVDLPAE